MKYLSLDSPEWNVNFVEGTTACELTVENECIILGLSLKRMAEEFS